MSNSLRANDKYKVQLLRDAHIQGEYYDAGDILDVLYNDYKTLISYRVAVELKEIKTEDAQPNKKKK